jgi:hypothetical protein
MLSNYQIADIAKDLGINLPLINILMKNELTKPKINNYIVNLQSNNQGHGTHWTALIISQKESFYFDAFGVLPSLEVIQFCKKRKGTHLYFNNWIVQDIESELCGWYCLGLLLYNKLYGNKYATLRECCNAYINMFHDNTKSNGDILKRFLSPYRIHHRNILINNE